MRKNILYAAVFVAVLIVSSFTVVATPENAPGQWKKNNGYANQREFVRMIHMRILERLQFSPAGLVKLVNIINEWATELETEEEPEEELEEEEEEPEEEPAEEEEEEPEEEPAEEEEEEPEEEPEEE